MSKTRKASKYDTLFVDLRDEERIQFARLIDEMMAAIPVKFVDMVIADMAISMDLRIDAVREMLDRAVQVWEAAKPAA
jgi:hypothetical protein